MSEPAPPPRQDRQDPEEASRRGPNLVLMYALILIAMLVATILAAFIVLPFYKRH